MTKHGKFITFEGPEGGGKSTQVRRLAERLKTAGVTVLSTREPGGTPTGEVIRGILQHDHAGEPICPEAELLLFEASRAQLVHHVILPALKKGTWVLCDRFIDSTAAYQGYGRGFDLKAVVDINTFTVGECVPDLTILLDVEIPTGMKRLSHRNREHQTSHDRFEREQIEFHERVRAGYLQLARRWPERIRVIDSMRDEAAVEEDVWAVVSALTKP
ncbi:MAG: dTMP kinase [bacterium]